MNVLTNLPAALKGAAGLLVAASAVAVFLSGRFSLRLKQKYWSGEKVSAVDNEKTRMQIAVLRIGAGICVVIAVIAWIAGSTLQAYQDS